MNSKEGTNLKFSFDQVCSILGCLNLGLLLVKLLFEVINSALVFRPLLDCLADFCLEAEMALQCGVSSAMHDRNAPE
jgi:hypothetical protein